jgi:plastocyanin
MSNPRLIAGTMAAATVLFGAALAVGADASRALSAPPATPAAVSVSVSIQDYAFVAPSITIAPGTTVVWTNKDDDPHTVTADDGSFDSKGLGQGDSYTHVFATAGRYPYHCAAHPFMKGVVIVAEGSGK